MSMHEISDLLSGSVQVVRVSRVAATEQALLCWNLETLAPRLDLDAGIALREITPQSEMHVYALGLRIIELAHGQENLDILYGWCAFLLNFWGWMPQEKAYSIPNIAEKYLPKMREIWRTHNFTEFTPWHPTLTIHPNGTEWFDEEHNDLIRKFSADPNG